MDDNNTAGEVTSLVGRLQELYASSAATSTSDIDLPGYAGELFARYEWLDQKRREVIQTRVMRQTKNENERNQLLAADTLIAACQGVFVRVGETGEMNVAQVLAKVKGVEWDRSDAGFDARLAELLKLPDAPEDPRDVLRGVFRNNDIAIGLHAAKLMRWMADTTKDANADFMGLGLGE